MKNWIITHIPLATGQSRTEETVNGLSHLLGAIACIPGAWVLFRVASASGNIWYLISSIVFMLSMCILYSSSAVYHLLNGDMAKRVGRIFDHASIYLLIAGTYTPIAFRIREPWGVVILSLVWGIALAGFLLKLFFWGRLKVLHVLVYLVMGWTIVLFWPIVTQKIPPEFIPYAFGGGIAYSGGVIFYAMKKVPFAHVIWHFFVLAGSVIFYLGIVKYIVV